MPQGPEPSRSRVGEMRRLPSLRMWRPSHPVPRGRTTKPRRESRQGTPTERARRRSPFAVRARGRAVSIENLKRLSATDISALASMKNVAKCDTWCELQNPVNHRVFERKLRPKPLGRGHVCLGVTHRRPHPHRAPPRAPEAGSGGKWPPVRSMLAVGPKPSPSRPERRDDRW